jgi:hypothetical protein
MIMGRLLGGTYSAFKSRLRLVQSVDKQAKLGFRKAQPFLRRLASFEHEESPSLTGRRGREVRGATRMRFGTRSLQRFLGGWNKKWGELHSFEPFSFFFSLFFQRSIHVRVRKGCMVYYGLLNGPVVVFCIAAVAKTVLRPATRSSTWEASEPMITITSSNRVAKSQPWIGYFAAVFDSRD